MKDKEKDIDTRKDIINDILWIEMYPIQESGERQRIDAFDGELEVIIGLNYIKDEKRYYNVLDFRNLELSVDNFNGINLENRDDIIEIVDKIYKDKIRALINEMIQIQYNDTIHD